MKVLYIASSFPRPDQGATIYTDLAEALYESGHTITVAVSEQTCNLAKSKMEIERGFEVLRIVTGNYYDVGLLEKGITTLRIPKLMRNGIYQFLGNRQFDFVLYESPPITIGSLIDWAKNYFNCPSYLMLKDIFPQNAVDLGIINKYTPIYLYFKFKEKKLYKSANLIGCMSQGNIDYILKKNLWLNKSKLELFPNTKKITEDYIKTESRYRIKYSIPNEACLFLFGGNMGRPQYVDLLCYALDKYKHDKEIYFLFVGRGTDRFKLHHTIKSKKIKNAKIINNLPRNEYNQLIKESDVGLIVLDPRFTIPNYPSRILSYMEYGKPVLAAIDDVTDIYKLVDSANCGRWTYSNDKDEFVKVIKSMSKSSKLQLLGENGRKYIENNLSIKSSVLILERWFLEEIGKE